MSHPVQLLISSVIGGVLVAVLVIIVKAWRSRD